MLATTLDGIDFLPALHALSMVVERLQTERQDEPYNNLYRFDSKQGAARQLNSKNASVQCRETCGGTSQAQARACNEVKACRRGSTIAPRSHCRGSMPPAASWPAELSAMCNSRSRSTDPAPLPLWIKAKCLWKTKRRDHGSTVAAAV